MDLDHVRFLQGLGIALTLSAAVWAGVAYGLLVLLR